MSEQIYYTDEEMSKVQIELDNYKKRYKEEQQENKKLKEMLKEIATINPF